MKHKKNIMSQYVKSFSKISINDVPIVGGKNASLGEMYTRLTPHGINVPDGFATTAEAFWHFIEQNRLGKKLDELFQQLDTINFSNLRVVGAEARKLICEADMPKALAVEILASYDALTNGREISVAVRSSATAEDLPGASFAGQHESYLNVSGKGNVLQAVQKCFASLFTDRAIKYRSDNGFSQDKIALSVGVQLMVRADMECSGICFTLEPESGFRDVVHIAGVWGLGENIVQGTVIPDEFLLFKPSLRSGKKAIIQKRKGEKKLMMVYGDDEDGNTINLNTPPAMQARYVLSDQEITQLGNWALIIEEHYGKPMDIEWAKDGETNNLYIIQARPETVHANKKGTEIEEYKLLEKGTVITSGEAIGSKIISGTARLLKSSKYADKVQPGDIVVTELTSPDWDPILKKAAAIITDKGGRTSHAAIVAREIGIPAIVATNNATQKIKDGDVVTVSCAEGKTGNVYQGALKWDKTNIDTDNVTLPEKTAAMLIVADPGKAFKFAVYPNSGVGLLRMEFIINHAVAVHPMALVKFDEMKDQAAQQQISTLTAGYDDKKEYFIDKLSQGVATIAAAFYPKDVIVRMSDFKTNEYANLLGGKEFEPVEENPMIGFRGASRYYNPLYKDGFKLECEAMKVVRNEMGLTNVKLMIPFCRTVEEGKKVIEVMKENGLQRGQNGLEIYVMAEIPSNVLLAEEFAEVFDGFSIGSNDLTQLTLGIDRDSALVADLFSEQNEAAKLMIATVIEKAKKVNAKIGLCGQAPSDFPEFAGFLVEKGIDSISFNPDALFKGIDNIKRAEAKILVHH
ncbi:MAG: phosphoenolpyruvate synthase [Flavipsychrobacter sp.]